MKKESQAPERPWGEKEISFLIANQQLLTEEEKAELGLTPATANNNFRANTDQAVVTEQEAVENKDTEEQK